MSIEMQDVSLIKTSREGDPLNQTTCCTRSQESACPGCCDMCTGKFTKKKACMSLFIFACCVSVVFTLDATIGNGMLMYELRLLLGLGNCGWLMSFKDKNDVCVEIPPKTVEERRRNLLRGDRSLEEDTSIHMSSAGEQSMTFYCSDLPEYAATNADCLKYCSAEYIYIKGVFLVEDEDDDRKSWKGFHLRVVTDEKVQNYEMDFAKGCKSEEYYLTGQTFVPGSFQCGYSEIGYDLYHRVPTSPCATLGNCETNTINGEKHYYARMNNLIFGPDLQNAINKVKDGTNLPGIYTHAYPKSYDNIVSGCTAEYKVDFVVPKKYAPVVEDVITDPTDPTDPTEEEGVTDEGDAYDGR